MARVEGHPLMLYLARDHILPAAYSLLPERMASARATAFLLAIGLQESAFEHRRQKPQGPARGFWQFEKGGGVRGVFEHPSTAAHLAVALVTLRYPADVAKLHAAIEHNDVLAAVFARLLLWTLPAPLPGGGDYEESWRQYLDGWRPGKPHRATWDANYATAWAVVAQ